MKRQQLRLSQRFGRDFEQKSHLVLARRAGNFSVGSLNWSQIGVCYRTKTPRIYQPCSGNLSISMPSRKINPRNLKVRTPNWQDFWILILSVIQIFISGSTGCRSEGRGKNRNPDRSRDFAANRRRGWGCEIKSSRSISVCGVSDLVLGVACDHRIWAYPRLVQCRPCKCLLDTGVEVVVETSMNKDL